MQISHPLLRSDLPLPPLSQHRHDLCHAARLNSLLWLTLLSTAHAPPAKLCTIFCWCYCWAIYCWGTLGSINQLFICIGILAALVAGLPLAGNPLCKENF